MNLCMICDENEVEEGRDYCRECEIAIEEELRKESDIVGI